MEPFVESSEIGDMKKLKTEISYTVFDKIDQLPELDEWLLSEARELTRNAYAPYSNFKVAAVAKMDNGEVVSGTNLENASFPAGICAERVLLGAASTQFPGVGITAMAISYLNESGHHGEPVTPCGICRQTLHEFEERTRKPIRLILGGQEGKIFIFDKISELLPLAFTTSALK